jgi:hypothetical protein
MTGWRQAVFVRQRRIDVIQRALSKVLDEESWSPAVPRRLHVGAADASSRGWTMIVPELANFFLDRGGRPAPRLCRLAAELHCPAYEVDVRNGAATTLFEVDPRGRLRISGSPVSLMAGLAEAGAGLGVDDPGLPPGGSAAEERRGLIDSAVVGFGLLESSDDIRDRIAALHAGGPMALADYLGALAGFPAWTHLCDDPVGVGAAGELIYEPPRIVERGHDDRGTTALATAGLTSRRPETREAIARSTVRVVPQAHDRRGTRPRSAARPRR